MVSSSASWSTVDDSTYTATVSFYGDLTGQSYNATQIADTFLVYSANEQLYRISAVVDPFFSSATLTIIEQGGNWGSPTGQVCVYNPDGRTTIPEAVFGSNGATAQLLSAVGRYNARQIGGLSATEINYSNINSKLKASNAQFAIDETRALVKNYYQYTPMGLAFTADDVNAPIQDDFAGWPHAAVAYDSSIDSFLIFYNINGGHNIGTNKVLLRKKAPDGGFDNGVVVADSTGTRSLKVQAAGIAPNGDYVALVGALNWGTSTVYKTYIYRSTDSGTTWSTSVMQAGGSDVLAFNGDVSGFLVTSTGRILTLAVQPGTYTTRIYYSDDNGATWTQSTVGGSVTDATEPAWIELPDGTIVAMLRKAVRTGTVSQVIPAMFTKSTDNGANWTEPTASGSITDFTLSNGHMILDTANQVVELIHHSRNTKPDNYSRLYISRATYQDAKNDNFGPQITIGRIAAYVQYDNGAGGTDEGDSGYVGCATGSDGTINCFYYNGLRPTARINWLLGRKSAGVEREYLIDPTNGDAVDLGGGIWSEISGNATYQGGAKLQSSGSDYFTLSTGSPSFGTTADIGYRVNGGARFQPISGAGYGPGVEFVGGSAANNQGVARFYYGSAYTDVSSTAKVEFKWFTGSGLTSTTEFEITRGAGTRTNGNSTLLNSSNRYNILDDGNNYYSATGIAAGSSFSINFDSNNNGTTDYFAISKNQPAIGGAGTELMRIIDSGNMGLGTTVPVEKLDVRGNINIEGTYLKIQDGAPSYGITSDYSYPTAGGTRMLPIGGFGAGPSFELIGKDASNSQGMLRVYFGSDDQDVTSTSAMEFRESLVGNTYPIRMIIKPGGNVGIGVDNPNDKLDVSGSIDATTGYKINGSATAGTYLRGNGTNFVSSTIQESDLPARPDTDISVTHTATNYTNSNSNLDGHLDGIDNALDSTTHKILAFTQIEDTATEVVQRGEEITIDGDNTAASSFTVTLDVTGLEVGNVFDIYIGDATVNNITIQLSSGTNNISYEKDATSTTKTFTGTYHSLYCRWDGSVLRIDER
ncbi:sialidase family protein [Flavilitoribacter nigricans]|nr:sialidase family protein [Flavilitoribacter nigricans]